MQGKFYKIKLSHESHHIKCFKIIFRWDKLKGSLHQTLNTSSLTSHITLILINFTKNAFCSTKTKFQHNILPPQNLRDLNVIPPLSVISRAMTLSLLSLKELRAYFLRGSRFKLPKINCLFYCGLNLRNFFPHFLWST